MLAVEYLGSDAAVVSGVVEFDDVCGERECVSAVTDVVWVVVAEVSDEWVDVVKYQCLRGAVGVVCEVNGVVWDACLVCSEFADPATRVWSVRGVVAVYGDVF